MRDEHVIESRGKKMALYAGLLDEAHSRGLRSIETELLQIPNADNGQVAIVKARIRTEEGVFEGHGDASPENVGRNIVPHIIRQAETRAKARALRDAINVSEALMDDASTHEEDEASVGRTNDLKSPRKPPEQSTPARTPQQGGGGAQGQEQRPQSNNSRRATDSQKHAIRKLLGERFGAWQEANPPLDEFDGPEAASLIQELQGGK